MLIEAERGKRKGNKFYKILNYLNKYLFRISYLFFPTSFASNVPRRDFYPQKQPKIESEARYKSGAGKTNG
jgi:hypothetical protein